MTMTSEDERLASARAAGERAAAETLAVYAQGQAKIDLMSRMLGNQHAAQRIAQASSGTAQDGLRIAFEAGFDRLPMPRPQLVLVKS